MTYPLHLRGLAIDQVFCLRLLNGLLISLLCRTIHFRRRNHHGLATIHADSTTGRSFGGDATAQQ